MSEPRFVPPHPPREAVAAPVWRGLFGERARNSVYGWSQKAFEIRHIRRQVLRFTVHIPLDPDAVQRVLQTNAANYAKPDIVKKLIAPMIGKGLLSADGDLWRAQRRIVAASFTPGAVESVASIFASTAEARMAGWPDGSTGDMAAEATATTMTIIADTLFGGDPRLKTPEAMHNIAASLKAGGEVRLSAILGLPPVPWNRTMRAGQRAQKELRRTLANVVRDRLPDGGDDFLGQLISDLHDRFSPAEALQLAVDNAATFYLAGHETTANAVTWTLYTLAAQPDLQEQAAAEARAALADGEPATLADRLPLLRRVLDETLRLYPPVPRFDRQAIGHDELSGTAVEPGDIVSIWPWVLHRHKALWDDPDAFDADRFLPDAKAKQHRFQYVPFGGGPRVCVGMRFSIVEALVILAHWLAAWRFQLPPGHIVRPVGTVTLKPDGGLPLIRTRRD
ncbi:cytochrome P450 [Parasphingopyxis algicola]|uniref:cytochrome P450 n=1 Tax=Parasphingopyxis algicola TaxID=2026624 RepID=UPI00159FF75E|nr:cytochrome P450 [Parasphingopyxis algicola]QLC25890.1 cytochrome P450 [Parasphingopyxis algicola]